MTCVFWNTMFVRSPSATSPVGSAAASFGTGALSPVSAASCTSRVAERDDPPVGRHDVAGLEQHDVARHELGRLDLLDVGPIAPHPGVRNLELRQRLDAGPGLELLARAHHDVERHQASATKIPVAIWPMAKLATATISSMMFIGFDS